jgi:hypothetical protein
LASTKELYDERLNRIKTAVALGKPDRVPVVPLGDSFCARHMGVKLSEFGSDPKLSNETIIRSFTSLGEVDGIQFTMFIINSLSSHWLSKLKIPGRDLPDNELWQVQEAELMKIEDYDTIINDGFGKFLADFYMYRLDNLNAKLQPMREYLPQAIKLVADRGIVPFSPAAFTIPYEYFCGGRSMVMFLKDLYRIPDKVKAAMEVAIPDIIEGARGFCRSIKPVAVWVGGWRSASQFLSPKLWQKFVFPYYKQLVQAIVDEGVIPVLHFDSNWTRDLEYLHELPKGKCVFSPDGATDIFNAKKVLGDHMCIMGDVPAALFALATTEEVAEYCKRLINEIGPSGYIMAQGCDIPPNAKPENVRTMIESVYL